MGAAGDAGDVGMGAAWYDGGESKGFGVWPYCVGGMLGKGFSEPGNTTGDGGTTCDTPIGPELPSPAVGDIGGVKIRVGLAATSGLCPMVVVGGPGDMGGLGSSTGLETARYPGVLLEPVGELRSWTGVETVLVFPVLGELTTADGATYDPVIWAAGGICGICCWPAAKDILTRTFL